VIAKILLILFGLILFLFLCRGFFRRRRAARSVSVEIFAEDHPRLTSFLRRLCDDVGAPLPHRIFVDYQVNAAAGYADSGLSLGKKNLYIGLGLVNSLNLTEFKAVLAHEFAHISQKSQAANNYAYVALDVAENMVCGRDFLDEWMSRGLSQDSGWQLIAFPLWGLSEALRHMFVGLFYGLLLFLTAFKRQMEFHADRV